MSRRTGCQKIQTEWICPTAHSWFSVPHFTTEENECLSQKMALHFYNWKEKPVKVGHAWKQEENSKYAISWITGGGPGFRLQRAFQSSPEKVPEEMLSFKRKLNVAVSHDQGCRPEQKCPYLLSKRPLNGLLIEGSSGTKGKKKAGRRLKANVTKTVGEGLYSPILSWKAWFNICRLDRTLIAECPYS